MDSHTIGVMIFIILIIVFVGGGIVFAVIDEQKRGRQEQAKYILDHH